MKLRALLMAALSTAALALPASARITVWSAPWDAASLSSIQANGALIDESNPVWYSMSPDGAIVLNWNAENPTWRAAMVGSDLMPTLQNIISGSFDAAVAQKVLSAANRDAHAEAIRQLVISKGLDGIDIDYERVPATSRADFSAFIESLAAKLHQSGKKLSVTVYAKNQDATWNGAGAQDWKRIGAVADSVKLMAYDFHWSTSEAGALTPLDWLDSVASYAEATLPLQKIVMGLPWYGYDWQGTAGKTVYYTDATKIAAANGAKIGRDANGEATFTYAGHVVYFNDATSYSRKIESLRAKHPGITSFAHWRSGNEDPAIWQVIRNLSSNSGGSGATPVKSDFTVGGPATVALNSGKSAAVTFSTAAIGGLTSPLSVTTATDPRMAASVSLSQSQIKPGESVRLTISASPRAASGVYAVRVRFTTGGIVHEVTLSVTINNERKH